MIALTAAQELDAAGIHGTALRSGYRRARALNAHHGRSYFLATMLLPAAKRPYVHALYGLARHVDDLVDETPGLTTEQRSARLDDWADAFFTDLEWGATSEPITRAVLDTVARWQIPTSYFTDFVTAMRADLTVTGYASYDELRGYMWGSAAVIGLQLLPILGRADDSVRWDVLETHAIALGTAFQLTNFLRDVAEDLRRGRVYLPQESLERFGVDRDRLRRGAVNGQVGEAVRNLLAWEIERARGLYAEAAPGIELVEASSRPCLRTALTLYAGILDEIEAADYDVFSGRLSVGPARRAVVATRAGLDVLRARRATPTG